MAILDALVTTTAGALFATAGVIVGGVVTRKAQDRQWLRDKQLAAYDELLSQYARFTMELSRAHYDRRPKDYDWAEWSAALVSASLVAPKASIEPDGTGRDLATAERSPRSRADYWHPVARRGVHSGDGRRRGSAGGAHC
jgi:hypothetical protein